MKRILLLLLIFGLTCYSPQRTVATETPDLSDVKAIWESMASTPMVKAVFLDYDKFDKIDLYQGNSDVEADLCRQLILLSQNKMNYSGGSNSKEQIKYLDQILTTYNDCKPRLRKNSILHWACPLWVGVFRLFVYSDYASALQMLELAEKFITSIDKGESSLYYYITLIFKTNILSAQGEVHAAVALMLKAMAELAKADLTHTFTFSLLERELADLYSSLGENELAIKYLNNTLKGYDALGISRSIIACDAYLQLAREYFSLDGDENLLNALDCVIQIQSLIKEHDIHDPDLLLDYYRTYFLVCYRVEDIESMHNICPQVLNLLTEIVDTQIPFMSEDERNKCWDNYLEPYYAYFLPQMTYWLETEQLTYCMYVALLQSRGLQLNCSNYFRNLVANSSDEAMASQFSRLNEAKAEYAKAKNDVQFNRDRISALNQEISLLEHSLLQSLQQKDKDILSWKNVTPEDIQRKLGESELAVEFLTVELDDDLLYCGLVLDNDPAHYPCFLELIKSSDFKRIKNTHPEAAASIWTGILSRFPEKNRIYFAPCGDFCNFPIELCVDTPLLPSDFSAVRLSSTRELVLQQPSDARQIVLLGGFDYDLPLSSIVAETGQLKHRSITAQELEELSDYDRIFSPLPGSSVELKRLTSIWEASDIDTVTGARGIETAFKALGGGKYKILHLATHGYFDNHGNNPHTAMDNCGLAFSGVNTLEALDEIPEALDDGKLTATEISNIDLRHTDLVCLSACQSGVTNVSAEGAYGLQRGFKLAGVSSMLMSLWSIKDDGPTHLMMDTFYRHLKSTGNKLESYRKAVREVRSQYPDFEDWAAFIIIDAI